MKKEYYQDYANLWEKMQIKPDFHDKALPIVNKIKTFKTRYQTVSNQTSIPWELIGCIHSLEGDLDFTTHLHNGDPLAARTVHVPPGRPKDGNPPFTWEVSAIDALKYEMTANWNDHKDVDGASRYDPVYMLYLLESYNGLGYRISHPDVKSPYLWSGTNNYTKGKYTEKLDSNGKSIVTFDPELVSKQIGAAILLKMLLGDTLTPVDGTPPVIAPIINKPLLNKHSSIEDLIKLQNFLNSFPGNQLNPDGIVGPKTLNRFREVFGLDMF